MDGTFPALYKFMLLRIFVSFIVGFLISLQVMAGGAPVCAKIYSEKTSSKAKQSSQEIPSVWGKDLSTLQKMINEYQPHFSKKSRLEKRSLTNNDMIRETLNWMISYLRNPETLKNFSIIGRVSANTLALKMEMMRDQKKINYNDFLYASYIFSKKVSGPGAHMGTYGDVYRSPSHRKFLILPTHAELSPAHINEMMAEGIMPVGLITKPVFADNRPMTPSTFFFHDLIHARNLVIFSIDKNKNYDQEKFKEAYLAFKRNIQHLSAEKRLLHENMWFLLTHERLVVGDRKYMAEQFELLINSQGEFDRILSLSQSSTDIPAMSDAKFRQLLAEFGNILRKGIEE